MYDYQLTTLPNGVRIASERMPGVRSAALGIWVTTGSREEKASESGAAHFIEHMLFKGTEKRTARQIAEVMDAVGPYVPACQMMGSMLAQIHGEVPQYLKLTAAGALADADPSILVAGTVKGLLSYQGRATVTPVNADAVAQRHGIKVETQARPDADGYASTVAVMADGTEVACTRGDAAQTARLVSLLGYKIDIAPGRQSLIFEYVDAPGRMGTIGTILGEAGINITTMQIGAKPADRCALVYMNVEGEVEDAVLSRLRAEIPELKNLWYVKL